MYNILINFLIYNYILNLEHNEKGRCWRRVADQAERQGRPILSKRTTEVNSNFLKGLGHVESTTTLKLSLMKFFDP